MKLFIIVVVSVIVCCNAQGDSPKAVKLLEAILNETITLIDKVESVVDKLESIGQEAQDYHEVAQQWYTQPNVFVSFASCEDIKTMSPSAPSGYYNITKYDGTTQRVYCDIEHSHLSCNGTCTEYSHQCGTASIEYCGSTGWTRVAYLNMSDPSQQCPTELRLYNESGVRACGRQVVSTFGKGSCDSVTFSTNGTCYSQVCGRVIGYQYRAPDAFHSNSIDSYYVDGISITRGSPRQHIWSLAAGFYESGTGGVFCPCNTGSTASVPSFVGDDYFCESGILTYNITSVLHTDDPLWDGEGCEDNEGPCCNAPGIPWFHKVFNTTTTDDIELRVCGDFHTGDEDVPISLYELYVK